MTKSASKIFSFARLKILLLLPEGIAFTLGVTTLRGHHPRLFNYLLPLTFLVPLGLGGVAAIIALFRFLKRLTLARHTRLPYSLYLAASQLTFFVGAIGGAALGFRQNEGAVSSDDIERISGIFFVYAFFWILARSLYEFFMFAFRVPPAYRGQESTCWSTGWIVPLAMGFMGLRGASFEEVLYSTFSCVAVGLVVSLIMYKWVLRPGNVNDLVEASTPFRARVAIAFLTVTTISPLGGLAVPLWFYLRRDVLDGSD